MDVILVDEQDNAVGTMGKLEVHQKALLHRAFSVFIFNSNNEMLIQQRAATKYHSPGLWTNACCSHPRPGEDTQAAANRRLLEELGFSTALQKAFAFTYKAAFDNGLTEHEFDHVFTGHYDGAIVPDPVEVRDFKFISIPMLEADVSLHPEEYTEWFKIALPRLILHLNS
jgi:isopentenyl-diphosphate Delta-isomerase